MLCVLPMRLHTASSLEQPIRFLEVRGRLHCRTLEEWSSALERAGFASFPTPMSAGTPFANVLIVAMPR